MPANSGAVQSEVEKHRAQNKRLQAQIKDKEMKIVLKKIERIGRVGCLSGVRQEKEYLAVQSVYEEKRYPIERMCDVKAVLLITSVYQVAVAKRKLGRNRK